MVGLVGTLIEGDTHSVPEWQGLLKVEASSITKLVNRNVLKKAPGAGGRYRMDFVGLISDTNGSAFVLPKVFDPARRPANSGDLLRVIRCIQLFERRSARNRRSGNVAETDFLFTDGESLISLFLSLLSWTRDHGLHVNDRDSLVTDPAIIDWLETVERGMALYFPHGLAFADAYGWNKSRSHSDLAVVQATALLDLYNSLNSISHIWISEYDAIIEACKDLLADTEADVQQRQSLKQVVLEADLHATKDHERWLVSTLRQWLEKRVPDGHALSLYGVNAFHVLWEDMCRVAFGASEISHTEFASQPNVTRLEGKISLAPQRPDLIASVPEGIVIADAKWYRYWRGDYPGTPDVTKQLMYELSASPSTPIVGNAFIVPVPDDGAAVFETIGHVGMESDGIADTRFRPIAIVGVQWNKAVDCYVSGVPLPTFREFLASLR
ncbi:LlaJI restriction endonuclease [Rhodobacter sp. JA431]|uniref:LlaJI family restriction endonuclease n=1 Tax=Rhodobacter sp. JA431 TaxID=570013 RepID=UPI000BCCE23A|nr:LlaJI family restriction endonuclease [Rhodobacter sp. JA431]SOC21695.1 LlaJI restriction endonuclease [Rhodobacter sp. JA431]